MTVATASVLAIAAIRTLAYTVKGYMIKPLGQALNSPSHQHRLVLVVAVAHRLVTRIPKKARINPLNFHQLVASKSLGL